MDNEKLRLRETFIRVKVFLTDNAADFSVGSIVAMQLAVIVAVVERLAELMGEQAGGFSNARFSFANKKTARKNLRENLYEFVRTTRSMKYQFPNITDKFRMMRGNNDVKLVAIARSFINEATPLKAEFMLYEMSEDFLDRLNQNIETFEATLGTTSSAVSSHIAVTAEIKEIIGQGLIALKILKGVVKNKYRDDAGKLAAWLSASHIERPPKKKAKVETESAPKLEN